MKRVRPPRAGFLTLDGLLGLTLVVLLAAMLGRAVHDQRRAANAGVGVRHAIDDLEAAAARLRAGEPAGDAVDAEPADANPGWLRLTPAGADSPDLFVHVPERSR